MEVVRSFDPSGNRLEAFGGYTAYQMDPDRAQDNAGNSGSASTGVTVPHDQGQ
jgi:hypothetical protein